MSALGIQRTARFFQELQRAREELIRMGSEDPTTASGHQDILFGQMLQKAEDAVKDEFISLIDAQIGDGMKNFHEAATGGNNVR